jgi:hypothetical protein
MWCALAAVLWLTNPYAAALLVPGAHLLLAVVAREVRLRRALALALVALAACALNAYEFVRYAAARDRIRHGTA